MRFKTGWRNEADDWSTTGSIITIAEKLEAIRQELTRGPVILEHWHYREARSPSRRIFEDYDDFAAYLEAEAMAGDAIDVWSWANLCTPEHRLAEGKCPADDGTVPRGGAY